MELSRSFVLAVLVLATGVARFSFAQEAISVAGEGSHERLIESVDSSHEDRFLEIVKLYDDHLTENPDDAQAATERCLFIQYFAYAEDFYIESAEELMTKSEAYLDRFESSAIVELYRLGHTYGDEAISMGEEMLSRKDIEWSAEQRAEIHLSLARQFNYDEEKVGSFRKHARLAYENQPDPASQLLWGQVLVDKEANGEAARVLKQDLAGEEIYQKRQRMNLLSQLDETKAALALLDDLRDAENTTVSHIEMARIYARAGRVEDARSAFAEAMKIGWMKEGVAKEAFLLEKKYGDASRVMDAYNQLRDQGFGEDPVLRYRLGLVDEHPSLPWRARDLLGVLALIGAVVGLILSPLLLLVPIHYWGLLRERKGKTGLRWTPSWGLRKAWLVIAMFLLVTNMVAYIFGYETLVWTWVSDGGEEMPDTPSLSLARICLFGELAVLAGLVLCLRKKFFHSFDTTEWSIGKGIGMAFLFLIPVKILAGINQGIVDHLELGPIADTSILQETLNAVLEHYGPFGLIFCVAILTPIIEEIIFRGVLLTAISHYIPFAWANLIQAFAFMIAHEHLEVFPFLFCFGLICGFLRKASGGLLPCILLHALHNGLIALVLIFLTP